MNKEIPSAPIPAVPKNRYIKREMPQPAAPVEAKRKGDNQPKSLPSPLAPKLQRPKRRPSPKALTKEQARNWGSTYALLCTVIALFIVGATVSYLGSWQADQSTIGNDSLPKNWMGQLGAWLAELLIGQGFGLVSVLFAPMLLALAGLSIGRIKRSTVFKITAHSTFWILFGSTLLAAALPASIINLGGAVGWQISESLESMLGPIGFWLLATSLIVSYLIFGLNIDLIKAAAKLQFNTRFRREKVRSGIEPEPNFAGRPASTPWRHSVIETETMPESEPEREETAEPLEAEEFPEVETPPIPVPPQPQKEKIITLEIQTAPAVLSIEEDSEEATPLPANASLYRFPSADLLRQYSPQEGCVTAAELEAQKDLIIQTLDNFKIGISKISATIGPTITLYEIVPEAGVRISKIKNLEDDIALSLAALGIRIIAPMPGKGTIGIEVPNHSPEIVSIREALSSAAFRNSSAELPIALGKSISNELIVADLAKMPHLLMAGATGQGKSVGINTIIASILYKKHPEEVKFVLIDPKKVELGLFKKIEQHFLPELPDEQEAIITDTKLVVNVLKSLCVEMDTRYDRLKDAGVRNIKEYNTRIEKGILDPKLNKRLPYIILVIDELADLMMTAGKEVELPIARLAQLARAIGIHLIVATQRPSVNIITGVIKANFPARIAFRVTSKVDSRTILDYGGADQLVGKGDLLFSAGGDIQRLQCPFIDTDEVEALCQHISRQPRPERYVLELIKDESAEEDEDLGFEDQRDAMFAKAAELIVRTQQGSTSMLQRRLNLGYNRAGRLMDQLEKAGIVGANKGSKVREVLVADENELARFLTN